MDFFHAARLADATLLANVATVGFNPRTEGAVQDFEIVSVGAEHRRRPAPDPGGGAPGSDGALAVRSLTPRGHADIDIRPLEVDLVSKPVTVHARVRTPDGRTVPRTVVFTFERASARRGGEIIEGRWTITGVRQLTD
jgi:hypothetical protein